jgi:hypothetical protein
MADKNLKPQERFQFLAQIETGKDTVSGFMTHEDALNALLLNTPNHAPDGLALHLNFTDPDSIGMRKFVGATPHKFDTEHLASWVFERENIDEPYTPTTRSFTDDSGLHFRHTTDVLDWQQAHDLAEQQSTRVYGLYHAPEDKIAWIKYGGYGWSSSQYPDKGPMVLWGQEEISGNVDQLMSFGGMRLDKIKSDIGDYPGFEFIHEIPEAGEHGDDDYDLASAD